MNTEFCFVLTVFFLFGLKLVVTWDLNLARRSSCVDGFDGSFFHDIPFSSQIKSLFGIVYNSLISYCELFFFCQ